MTRYDKLKQEISAMSLDDFMNNFSSSLGVKHYICPEIKAPHAHCTKQGVYDCILCIKAYLNGEVEE